jgi:hypothetical protein
MMKPGMGIPRGPVPSTMSTPSGVAGMAQRPLFQPQNQSLMGVGKPSMAAPSAPSMGMSRPPQSLFAPRQPSPYNSMPAQGAAGRPAMPMRAGGQAAPPTSLRDVASMGRYGDTMLAHINPREAMMLKAAGGSGTVNPATGLREFWDFGGSGTDTLGPDSFPDNTPTATFDNPIDADFDMGGGTETRGPYQPGFWESTLWGLGGTILTGNPLLGAAAAKFGPQAWNSLSSWASGLSPDRQAAAQKAVETSLAGQKHISERNINDALAAAYAAGGGSDNGGAPRITGRRQGVWPNYDPIFDADIAKNGWPDARNPNWDTDPRNPAAVKPKNNGKKYDNVGDPDTTTKPRKVIPYTGDIKKYGQGNGAHVFFDRWF